MSGGGFLRRGPDSSSSYSSSYSGGQSRTDEPEQTPQQRDEQKARGELMRAHQLAADAKKLDDVPAAAWEETRDQLAAKVEAFAAGLRSPSAAGFAPSDNADQDRAATIAAVEKARTTIKHAKRPRNVPAVAGEEEIEPRIADKSIAPEDVIDWMAGLSKSERAAVWRRYTEAANSRADTFAVALANYIARHRDRSPPLATDLHALATMDARRFAEWRELSGRGPQIGQSTPTTEPAQSRPLDPAGQSFADPARDQDHDGRADLLSGQRETPPPPEQTQADAAATRAGVEQAIAALGDTAGQVLPAYDDAIGALNPAAAYQLQARAIFVFRQAVTFRTQLRTMGGTEALAQLERAISTRRRRADPAGDGRENSTAGRCSRPWPRSTCRPPRTPPRSCNTTPRSRSSSSTPRTRSRPAFRRSRPTTPAPPAPATPPRRKTPPHSSIPSARARSHSRSSARCSPNAACGRRSSVRRSGSRTASR
jgi:hypothetical protein